MSLAILMLFRSLISSRSVRPSSSVVCLSRLFGLLRLPGAPETLSRLQHRILQSLPFQTETPGEDKGERFDVISIWRISDIIYIIKWTVCDLYY